MFVIVQDKSVVLGPMHWNKFRFQNFLREECETEITDLPQTNQSDPVVVSSAITILPVETTPNPEYNPKIQFLNGPFWVFTQTKAIASYVAENYSIEAVRNFLKARTAAERYTREISGIVVTINNAELQIGTSREQRLVFAQQLLMMQDNESVQWKFNQDVWVELQKQDFQSIVSAINAHVQQQFEWEAQKIAEIDAASTLELLDAIEIQKPRNANEL